MNDFVADRSLQAIGRVVVWSADVDSRLAGILNDLVGSDRARLLTTGQPFSYLDQAIRAVVKHHWEDGQGDQLFGFLERAKELHSERDLIVHGLWLPKDVQSYLDYVSDVDPTEYYTVRPRRWRNHYHGQILTDDTINELADKLQNLSAVLRKWRDDYLPYIEANTDADVND
jgi:hypothetical protein